MLLIGTGRHENDSGLPAVPATAATLQALRRSLIERCGVAPRNIRVLLDPADPMTMGDAIATVAEQATAVLLVYFVGHGLMGTDPALHLAARSSKFRPNRVPHTALPYRTMREYIRDSPARSKIVILDCCWGGLAIETLGADANQFAEMSRIDGTFVLTAAGPYEEALASSEDRFTKFSGTLLRWLADGDSDGGAELTLDDMYRRVRADLLSRGGPEPRRRATGGTGDLVVMRNPAYVASQLPAPPIDEASVPDRRRRRLRRPLLTGLAALTVLGPLAGYGVNQAFSPTCTGSVQVTVEVAPEIADEVSSWAEKWINGRSQPSSEPCVTLSVTPATPAAVAVNLAARTNRTVTGLNLPGVDRPLPDVWLSDSSLWLDRVRAVDRTLVPATAPSIATSPVVVAVADEFPATAEWVRNAPSWSRVRDAIGGRAVARYGIVNPAVDASALVALQAMEPEPGESAASARHGLFKALSAGHTEIRDELMNKLGPDPILGRPLVDMAVLPEYEVRTYNAENPRTPLTAVSPTPFAALDYPYAILPSTTGYKATAALQFGESLTNARFAETLQDSGFRPPTRAVASKPQTIDTLLASWLMVDRPLRVLSIIDVSGASAETVPETGGASRLKVASTALAEVVASLDDKCAVGISTSSANRDRLVVSTGPLVAGRPDIQTALASLTTDRNSPSTLDDAIIAGYKDSLDIWQPGQRNLILAVASGNGLDLPKVGQELRRLKDPNRPVDVAVVALGPGVHPTAGVRLYPASANGSEVYEGILRAVSNT